MIFHAIAEWIQAVGWVAAGITSLVLLVSHFC